MTVVLEGDEFRWELELLWMKYGAGDLGSEDVIDAKVKLEVTRTGLFTAERSTPVLTSDLVRFQDSLAELLSTMTGQATLLTFEQETGVTITASDTRGAFEVDVFVLSHAMVELRAKQLRTTERQVRAALTALRDATETFPVGTRWAEDA